MNPDNYCTLEAAKKLVEMGIVMETEKYWVKYPVWETWRLVDGAEAVLANRPETVPAPSLAEVWRELNKYLPDNKSVYDAIVEKMGWTVATRKDIAYLVIGICKDVNNLIDLRCWLEKRKELGIPEGYCIMQIKVLDK